MSVLAVGSRTKACGRSWRKHDAFVKLWALNERLGAKSNGAYPERWALTISATLKLRNEYGHSRGDTMAIDDATCVIDMVTMILRHLPEH